MANVKTNSVNYSAIAEAIRARLGASEKYKPSQMAAAIMNISGSGGDDYKVLDSFIEGTITEITTQATVISEYALAFRPNLQKFTAYSATTIKGYAFGMDVNLTELNIDEDKIVSVGECALAGIKVESIRLPRVERIEQQCMAACSNLKRCDLGSVIIICDYAFEECSSLDTFIIRTPVVCELQRNVFRGTKIVNGGGYVYVPAALLDQYKQTECWKSYVNQLRAIEDYPEITQE